MTGFVPLMWAVWLVMVLLFAAVSVYASHLAKNEEDQLCLDDSSSRLRAEQDVIAARVRRVEPVKRVTLSLAGVMTLVVLGYYVLNMVDQFR